MRVFLFILWLLPTIDAGIPDLNRSIILYVESNIGIQVGSGECWDLAAAALKHAGAYLDQSSQKTLYVFGKKVDPNKEKVYPGDILQMENVKLQYTEGDMEITESMKHHTAIVYEVIDRGNYQVAHQNTSFSGRKVGVSNFNLNNMKSGKVIVYRPIKK